MTLRLRRDPSTPSPPSYTTSSTVNLEMTRVNVGVLPLSSKQKSRSLISGQSIRHRQRSAWRAAAQPRASCRPLFPAAKSRRSPGSAELAPPCRPPGRPPSWRKGPSDDKTGGTTAVPERRVFVIFVITHDPAADEKTSCVRNNHVITRGQAQGKRGAEVRQSSPADYPPTLCL